MHSLKKLLYDSARFYHCYRLYEIYDLCFENITIYNSS